MPNGGQEGDIARAMDGRREAILAVADGLLGEAGLEGLTIRRILALTGLARRAFYDIFATKDELMLALFTYALGKAALQVTPADGTAADPAERLARLIHSIAATQPLVGAADAERAARRGAAFSREHLRLAQTRPDDLDLALRPLIALLHDIIADGIAAGQWTSDNPARDARFIYNLVSSTVHGELLGSEAGRSRPADRVMLARDLTRFCTTALSACGRTDDDSPGGGERPVPGQAARRA